jgi:hypothetical protein
LSELLALLVSTGAQLLQKSEGPVEETLCFSVVPLAVLVGFFALRARRWRPDTGAQPLR